MLNPMQEEIATSILKKDKVKAKAKAILDRPSSKFSSLLNLSLSVCLVVFLQSDESFQAPTWVKILLALVTSWSVQNMLDLWGTRRRLDAALTLLKMHRKFDE